MTPFQILDHAHGAKLRTLSELILAMKYCRPYAVAMLEVVFRWEASHAPIPRDQREDDKRVPESRPFLSGKIQVGVPSARLESNTLMLALMLECIVKAGAEPACLRLRQDFTVTHKALLGRTYA